MEQIRRELCFSEPFLKVEYIKNFENLTIDKEHIIINLDSELLILKNERLNKFESGVFCNLKSIQVNEALLISTNNDIFSYKPYQYAADLINKWSHVYEVFPFESLKNVKLWRSPKDRIGNVEFNLWYAPEKTDCAIHNEHDFSEIHTQVYGIGYMQKFHKNDKDTIYQVIGLLPGSSHKKFCNDRLEYPWHQYLSETDCIWLVMEETINDG